MKKDTEKETISTEGDMFDRMFEIEKRVQAEVQQELAEEKEKEDAGDK